MSDPDWALRPPTPPAGGPVFVEPWHAEGLAIVQALVANGLFSAAEWTGALGHAVATATARGEPDTDDTYYHCVLAALERLVSQKTPDLSSALEPRVDAWRRAYLATPHGQPVMLDAADRPPLDRDHDHDHDHHDHGPC